MFSPMLSSSIVAAIAGHLLADYSCNMRKLIPLVLFAITAAAQDVHVKVDPHGPGSTASTTDYTTIQQALDHAPQAPHGRIFIHIVPGTYKERINVTRLRPRVTLLGEGKGPEDVLITAA